jgi:hypothetical protein
MSTPREPLPDDAIEQIAQALARVLIAALRRDQAEKRPAA